MITRIFTLLILLSVTFVSAQNTLPVRKSMETSSRAIRLDIPMTKSIQKAFKEGTRNFSGKPGSNYWQLKTDYTINASIDPRTQIISGSEVIKLHNNSPKAMQQIVLKLDHNIFRADVPRGSSVPAETTEGMVLTRLVINGDVVDLNLRPRPRVRGQRLPNRLEIFGKHKTVATIVLEKPIPAKSVATIEIDFYTKLPGGQRGRGHRMTQRWDNTLFQPTQWFPRVAKFDDLRGWKTDVYLGPAEFFNNFGRFDVKIDAPEGWLVSGTGVLQNPEEVLTPMVRERLKTALKSNDEITIVGANERGKGKATAADGSHVWHFVAENVNDFVWATAKDFIWQATRATIPGKGAIPIHMLYLPKRAHLFEHAGEKSRHALEFYSDLWAPYPFPQLTLQDGPSAGMEYPMVINSNQGAADHEVAHQWWPMMLGTNEARYGWMDEGFNSFMNILSRADAKGEAYNLDGLGQRYGSRSGDEDEATLMWAANHAGPGYGYQTYVKVPLMLSMLGAIVGDDAVQQAMKKYTKTWAFKHPSPWDYIFFMNQELDQNLEWFWYYWLWTTESVDGSIQNVATSGGTTKVTVHQAGQMPSPVILKVEFESSGPALKSMKNSKMLTKNVAIVTWPANVWFNGSRTFEANLDFGGRKIKKITLDPGARFPDKDTSDNTWTKNK